MWVRTTNGWEPPNRHRGAQLKRSHARPFANILVAGGLVSLAACASPPRENFDLGAATAFHGRAPRGQVAVLDPSAILPAGTDRIVVRTSAETVTYLGGAQWVDRLPVLLHARLIETLENAKYFRGVGRLGILADHSLYTEIRRFELDAEHGEAVVELYERLTGPGGETVAGRLFSARAPVPSGDPTIVAAALNRALGEVMRDIAVWAAQKV